MKTPDYLSYERYKKKKDGNPNKKLSIFLTTFFATLLLFTVVAKSLSPNVDVTIGEDTETDAKETGLGVKKFIDERLKIIQMDDTSNTAAAGKNGKNGANTSVEQDQYQNYAQTQEEKVTIPAKKEKMQDQEDLEDQLPVKDVKVQQPPRPTTREAVRSSEVAKPVKPSKVFVGRYSTLEQAKVAQEILMDSGLNITPFVRNSGSYYTLQIGSYSSRAKAEDVASELQRNSFPARVVSD